ncbi:YeeE/YedE family protein [Reichenbachiella versicolor]|uniref:YeeE/YedE family protein n=1 Tax=Reichenbachiella versicolor TaxID=1821036 RepID=UPI000D6DD2B0|nr:YeeE/YedE thiosulfate transporter family protein [Reichenbachiella versicolor]
MNLIEYVSQPWPWYVAGPLIAVVMTLLLIFGKKFGISSNLETICTIAGAGKFVDYFKVDWKKQVWNLVFVLGCVIGGYIAQNFLMSGDQIAISDATVDSLKAYGLAQPGQGYLPDQFLGWEGLTSMSGLIMMVFGGLFVGFGTRYAGGCTSGHAISGLSNLQLPSLIAVVGFFIGGLITTHFILPILFAL